MSNTSSAFKSDYVFVRKTTLNTEEILRQSTGIVS